MERMGCEASFSMEKKRIFIVAGAKLIVFKEKHSIKCLNC